ncbi:MAG: PadR family transcriptional regulator [Bryobacter sp.]|jgi:PadR family transcriptional regulator PadR|nr:PadR family transcriptional regulator [Bryobacter sp.]
MMEYSPSDRDRRITQLRKGILELAVMAALEEGPHYGYSLIRKLADCGSISLKEGTVYPILARLDRDGVVHSEWVVSAQGPPRKYYTLTPAGRQLLAELTREFDLLVSLVQRRWSAPENASPAVETSFVSKEPANESLS